MPPDEDGFPFADEIANWNQKPKSEQIKAPEPKPARTPLTQAGIRLIAPSGADMQLTPEENKAISIILSRKPFVLLGISPTGDTGADFFVAVEGDKDVLRAAKDHLPGVINRAFDKRGIV
jgi:hypothetical protein